MGARASKLAAVEGSTKATLPAKGKRLPGLTDRPRFHVAPKEGWINDPNGPFWHDATAHL